MGREIKRVPVDFDWELNKIWDGFIRPDRFDENDCPDCEGAGWSPRAKYLKALWYGHVPFRPEETGSTPLRHDTPAVRAFAERNVERAPDYYGTGGWAIRTEAQRLANLWNGQWGHHLTQDDVDALVESGRLKDLTHTWTRETQWQPKEPAVQLTAAMVNEWSLSGFGHDSSNCWIAMEARCKREGVDSRCATCAGQGSFEAYEGQRAEAEAWERNAAVGVKWQWISRLDHGYKAGWLGDNACCRALPLIGYLRGYCTRPVADHADDGPFCPECAPGALSERRATQEAWWTEEVQRRAASAGEG